MDIAELAAIESEEQVEFRLKPGGKFTIKGTDPAIAKALARISDRDEVVAALRLRDGAPEPIVERESRPTCRARRFNGRTTNSGWTRNLTITNIRPSSLS